MNILELSEQEIVRRNNLQQLRDLGIDPYPAAAYPTDAFSTEIKENFVEINGLKQINFSFRIMAKQCTLTQLVSGFKIL